MAFSTEEILEEFCSYIDSLDTRIEYDAFVMIAACRRRIADAGKKKRRRESARLRRMRQVKICCRECKRAFVSNGGRKYCSKKCAGRAARFRRAVSNLVIV